MQPHPVRLFGAPLALALLAAPALAQVPTTPRALGMGGAFMGVARGQEALWENPANLGLPGNPRWSVAFPQIVVGETTVGLGIGDLRDLKDYDTLDPAHKAALLAKVPAQGTVADVDFRLPVAAFASHGVAVGVAYLARVDHGVSKDIVDLFLNGYDQARAVAGNYSFPNTTGHRASYIDVAAAHGRRVGPLSLGVTGHYYIGRSVLSSQLDPTARYCAAAYPAPCVAPTATAPQDVNVDYYSLQSSGGHGYGVDLGAAFQPLPGLTLGAVVQNAASSMKWDTDLHYRLITFSRNDFENSNFTDVADRYDRSETAFSASAPAKVRALQPNLFDGTDFARVVRMGAAYHAATGTTIGGEYRHRSADSRLQGMWSQSYSVGVSQNLKVAALSVGAAKDDADGTLLSAGLALGPLKLGIGRLNNGTFNGADRKGWVATFALSAAGPAMP